MSIGYGSITNLPKLSANEVGAFETKTSSSSLTTFLRILITIVEIGVGFIPGVNVAAETAVALIGGAINEGLDVSEGNASVVGGLLNFVAPLLGGGFSGLKNIRNVGKTAEILENQFGTISKVLGLPDKGLNEIKGLSTLSKFNKGVPSTVKALGKDLKLVSGNEIVKSGIKVGDNLAQVATEDKRFSNFLIRSGLTTSKQLELTNILRGVTSLELQRTRILGFVRDLPSREALTFFRNVTGEIERVALGEAWQLPYARQILHEFDVFAANNLNEQFLKREVPTLWKRIVRKVGSAQFNDKVVQRAQLIDPNDAGRAGIEHMYQIIKKQIRKYFKSLKKTIKNVDNLEDAFVKGGGILVDSDWHLGYKVIKDLGVNKQLIQITYGKDTGRYRHVMVFASDAEIKRYIGRPGNTYINEWAFSRGGKKLGLESMFSLAGIKALGNQAASVLGFLPIQALKNVLSLVSNYVENGSDIVKGTYSNSYIKKFTTSLRNSVISRSFRLLGKEILGGVIGNVFGAKIGDFIGKEAQRVGTQILATGIKNVIAGKDFNKGLANKAIAGALTSVRSNSLRRLRNTNSNSVIVQTLSARRKLQQVKRIPNALVPGRPFKGIKF